MKWLLLFPLFALCLRADFQGATHLVPYDDDAIAYSKTADDTPITRLQKRIDAGETKLKFDATNGYLTTLLRELNLPAASQLLVFSKTSLQRDWIHPGNPRALFYNDDVYLGFIPGAPMIELSAIDPKLGPVFYTIEQKPLERPKFTRNNQCLECHASSRTLGVPGLLVRSFVTDETGAADLATGITPVNHRTPFEDRWGGWYVTGQHGKAIHRGNLMGEADSARQAKEPNFAGNLNELSKFFNVEKFPRSQSDVVALMVVEHQTHMHNFIARLQFDATIALKQYGHVRYLKTQSEAFLRYLLFIDEAPLPAPVRGSAEFVAAFSKASQRDAKGRSLRDFDLQTRMFKHPCSYLIYSSAFDALPVPLKDHLYARLFEILSGQDQTEAFSALKPDSRRAILEILRATKKDLPDKWRKET